MVIKRYVCVLAGILVILLAACQTGPANNKEDAILQEYSILMPEGLVDFWFGWQDKGASVGIGYSENESRRKEIAFDDLVARVGLKTRSTSVWLYRSDIDQYFFDVSFSLSLPPSTLSSWLKENGILPKAEYSEGEWYAVAYAFSEISTLPLPIEPVTSLNSIEQAVISAAGDVSDRLPGGSKIAIVNIGAADPDDAEFVIEELSTELVKASRESEKEEYTMVDRRSLDAIRAEQNFQMGGDVSEDTVVSIGKFLGADVVITGSITGANEFRRLRVKALDVKTARLLIQKNLKY
ncbi:MAG: CsgG/HfaB family protein [Treponema sp.]|jgi:hypothetical protein|nr:CsgG/HfaB family protein [Treponema sp.]